MEDYITTYTKVHFKPLDPVPEQIRIRDIAHALSLMTRANGHFPRFYSVAQHCLDCANLAEREGLSARVTLACLLHDASEAYLSDVTRPVKKSLKDYQEIEEHLQKTIFQKYIPGGLTPEEEVEVARIDDICLYYEFEYFMGEKLFQDPPHIMTRPTYKDRLMRDVEEEYARMAENFCEEEIGGENEDK